MFFPYKRCHYVILTLLLDIATAAAAAAPYVINIVTLSRLTVACALPLFSNSIEWLILNLIVELLACKAPGTEIAEPLTVYALLAIGDDYGLFGLSFPAGVSPLEVDEDGKSSVLSVGAKLNF